ncbi:thermonuclease family protein [Niallia sp. 03133]|uniref:thermonuclease family protein n=1 Tax=Niallia sp. 03133 TaxID=3458060 RepID=UPI004044DB92
MKKIVASCLVIMLCVTAGCSQTSESGENREQSTFKREAVKLDKAIDGDTIGVVYKGEKEKVRFLLVDTPETSHPRFGEQPYGKEAKAFTRNLVEQAKTLQLEFDIGQNRDKYGRLLAYVYADGEMIQEKLLQKGFARVAYIYAPNTRYVDSFTSLQKKAQQKGIGIWKVENYAQDDGFHKDLIEPKEEPEKKANNSNACNIKGNITSSAKIYHTPDSRWYKQTKEEVMFCSEEDAINAGFRAPK